MANDKNNQPEELRLSNAVRKVLAKKASSEALDKLQALVEEKLAGQQKQPENRRFLIDGRVTLPALGGLALPKGVGFHGYVTFELEEDEPGLGITNEEALAHAEELAADQFPHGREVTICSVSQLPEGW